MFTGIIHNTGVLKRDRNRLSIESSLDLSDIRAGDSIAVNGVCLTAVQDQTLLFDLGPETLLKTTLGFLKEDSLVHLEKAMRLSDRVGGHLVQGHVDGLGKLVAIKPEQDSLYLNFETAQEILKTCTLKGSVSIDGVSLTINQLDFHQQILGVCLVPYTIQKTLFKLLELGDLVNIENDRLRTFS